MKLRENELKIFYQGEFNEKLQEVFMSVLKTFGYRQWASGTNTTENVRDLAYKKEE